MDSLVRAIAVSDSRLTKGEARPISKLISRFPELVELERDRNKAAFVVEVCFVGARKKGYPVVLERVPLPQP
jgi:hypothetical protein